MVLTVPLFTSGLAGSVVRQASDRDNSAMMDIESTRRDVVQLVAQAWDQLVSSKNAVDLEQSQLDLEKDRGSRETGSSSGWDCGTTVDLLNAEFELANARLALVQSQHDRLRRRRRALVGDGPARGSVPDAGCADLRSGRRPQPREGHWRRALGRRDWPPGQAQRHPQACDRTFAAVGRRSSAHYRSCAERRSAVEPSGVVAWASVVSRQSSTATFGETPRRELRRRDCAAGGIERGRPLLQTSGWRPQGRRRPAPSRGSHFFSGTMLSRIPPRARAITGRPAASTSTWNDAEVFHARKEQCSAFAHQLDQFPHDPPGPVVFDPHAAELLHNRRPEDRRRPPPTVASTADRPRPRVRPTCRKQLSRVEIIRRPLQPAARKSWTSTGGCMIWADLR